jgi:PTS system mannitol-specific IIC component
MNPILIIAPMVGNICGILTLSILGGGLKAAASPGSIIAEMLMTPKGCYFANIAGIAVAARGQLRAGGDPAEDVR